jgi:RloB-like protein
MILTYRRFERETPTREAKSIYIFAEGAKREFQYFKYFRGMDSRINVEVYELEDDENNSPLGLLNIAKKCIIANEENPNPKYSFQENDEVWIVLDTDKDKGESRKSQIEKVRGYCKETESWFLAQSNPCFEVWLYYHLQSEKPIFAENEYCSGWKELVNKSISGGFDSRKHPIFIENASNNAEKNYTSQENIPDIGSTEVFKLSQSILPLVKIKIMQVLSSID